MMCDILSSWKSKDDSLEKTIELDQSLNSAKLWRQAIDFRNFIILDIKFYSRSEESLEVIQASVFNGMGSLLQQFSGLPDHSDIKALAEDMNYVDNDGHYTYNGEVVVSQTGLLKGLVAFLNFLASQKNIVMCTYSTDAVIAPLLNNLEANGLLKELTSDCFGCFDVVSFTTWKFVGKLIRDHGQSYMEKDIIAKLISDQWKKHSERMKSYIQPLHLISIVQNPDILFLDRHNIKQITTPNRLIIQVHTQDCQSFKFLLVLPSINPDWQVASVLKVGTRVIQIKFVMKKPIKETEIASFGFLMPSSQDQITLGNMRVIAHVLGPRKSHSFRSMELWKKIIPIVEAQNIIYPHVLGHQKVRKIVKNLAFSEDVPSPCEVLILSLGFSQEGARHFSISNISKRRRLNLSDQSENEGQELIKELGNGSPKIVIGHNVMDMLDTISDTSKVFGIIELEWLLSEDQRQTFDIQPSWSDIVGKHLGFDFPFIPVQSFEIHYFTLLFIKKQLEQYDLTLEKFVEKEFRRFILPCSMCIQLRPRDSNVFISTHSKDLKNGTTAPSTITLRSLEDLTKGIPSNNSPQNPAPTSNVSDTSIVAEQTNPTCLITETSGYLKFNLLILNLKSTTPANTSFVSAVEAYLPAQNRSFYQSILPEGINQEILIASGYLWNGKSWNLERDGSTNQVMVESECLQKLKAFVETWLGYRQRFVLVVPCVKTFGEFLIMLKRHNCLKNFLLACRGWLDVKCLIYLKILSPRQYFIKALDLESGELFQLYKYMCTKSLGHLKHVPNIIGKILKTLKDFNFYDKALPVSLHVKPYNLVYVNARTLKYSVDRQYECLSVIYAKNIANGETFHCAIAPYGVWDPKLVQELGYKQSSNTWVLEHEGKVLPCVSLMDGMIKFLRFMCAHTNETMKTILICSVFRESLAHLFEVVEFMKANSIFFNEVVAIFDFATYHFIVKKHKFLVTEAILNYYKNNSQSGESRCPELCSASDIVGQSEEILECLAMQAQECAIGVEDMIAKNAHGWNSPTWNKLLKESHILMFQDHVFPLELAATVSMPENLPKLVPCQVAQPVVSFSDKLYTTLSHPMTNIIVHERIEMSPDKPLDIKISCHGNHKELKKGTIIGLICRQDRFHQYTHYFENNLVAINQQQAKYDQNLKIQNQEVERKRDIRLLAQSNSTEPVELTQSTKEKSSNIILPISTEKNPILSLEFSAKENTTIEKEARAISKGPPQYVDKNALMPKKIEQYMESIPGKEENLANLLDNFLATDDQQETNDEATSLEISLDELQEKYFALFEFPSFAPLIRSYIRWCSMNGQVVDETVGDTIITHLVGLGCESLDALKKVFWNLSKWTESQIRTFLIQEFPSIEMLMSKNVMKILLAIILLEFGPSTVVDTCSINEPAHSVKRSTTETQEIDTAFHSDVEKGQQLECHAHFNDDINSPNSDLDKDLLLNSVLSVKETNDSEKSIRNSSLGDENANSDTTVLMKQVEENHPLGILNDNKDDSNPRHKNTNESIGSKKIFNLNCKNSNRKYLEHQFSNNPMTLCKLGQIEVILAGSSKDVSNNQDDVLEMNQKSYQKLPFSPDGSDFCYGTITTVSVDNHQMTADFVDKGHHGTLKMIIKCQHPKANHIFKNQTAIIYRDEDLNPAIMTTTELQKYNNIFWGFFVSKNADINAMEALFCRENNLRSTHINNRRIFSSTRIIRNFLPCLFYMHSSGKTSFALLSPNPSLVALKRVRPTNKPTLLSYFREEKFYDFESEHWFCILPRPSRAFQDADFEQKFVLTIATDQDPQEVQKYCKKKSLEGRVQLFFRPGRVLVMSNVENDQKVIVKAVSEISATQGSEASASKSTDILYYVGQRYTANPTVVAQSWYPYPRSDYNTYMSLEMNSTKRKAMSCEEHVNLKRTMCPRFLLKDCSVGWMTNKKSTKCKRQHKWKACFNPEEICFHSFSQTCFKQPCPLPHMALADFCKEYHKRAMLIIKICKKCNAKRNPNVALESKVSDEKKASSNEKNEDSDGTNNGSDVMNGLKQLSESSRKRAFFGESLLGEPSSKMASLMPNSF